MKIPGAKNFRYQEFYSKYYYDKWKDTPYWITNVIDPRVPLLVQFMRDRWQKSITVNNWLWRGEDEYPYDDSGFRDEKCTIGSKVSRHLLGLCADIKVSGMEAQEVQQDIKDNFDEFSVHGLTAIEEDTRTWTHLGVEDTSWRRQDELWIIPNPNKK